MRKKAFKFENVLGEKPKRIVSIPLAEKEAARYIGETLSIFRKLVYKGLIPPSVIIWNQPYNCSIPEITYYSKDLDRYIESKKNV